MKRERLICAVIIGYGLGLFNASQLVDNPIAKIAMAGVGAWFAAGAWLVDYKLYRDRGRKK